MPCAKWTVFSVNLIFCVSENYGNSWEKIENLKWNLRFVFKKHLILSNFQLLGLALLVGGTTILFLYEHHVNFGGNYFKYCEFSWKKLFSPCANRMIRMLSVDTFSFVILQPHKFGPFRWFLFTLVRLLLCSLCWVHAVQLPRVLVWVSSWVFIRSSIENGF